MADPRKPLDFREQKENIVPPLQPGNGNRVMSKASSFFDNSHYEKACDQAIAMCDGNLRSTIKVLIMANEYLEAELLELQVAIASGCAPLPSPPAESNAA
jgi:hypothetical protein